ncbi:DUF2877 domain-containing protein [Psychrobacillus glaciei]|uniref:DUF2877 domain-containing protein n=1 Tax=Psychrobacillus glaciei TaxID=2283160 RepID=A0A5J6SQY2_9BACI|nr:DUF2877 domain-containing protein [Psychrobacillus glaciei]QFG00341.1 DUF2877 domain-containing protein [Psychrobacillus glaciei]
MVSARSGDVDFIQRVIHSKLSGFVHSTFKRTLNIQCLEDGELYTIACNEIDNGPNTLIVDLASFEDMNINAYDEVHSDNNIISIGNKMSITIDRANSWESILPTYPANTDVLKKNIKIMKQYIEIHGKSGGIKSKSVNESPFEQEMSKMIQERKGLLTDELVKKQLHHAVPHAVSLLGLGPGLTPSGDDFLVGLFTSFHLKNSPFVNYQWFFEEIERAAKTATNEISYIAIKKASVGKIRESIIALVNGLLEENEEHLILSLKKVLNIGSSSGTDIALGILTGLETNIKIGGTL